MNEENDRKIKIIIKINNVLIKILLIFVCFLACSSLFYKNEVFAMDHIERELWQKYSFKRMPDFIVPRSGGATATLLQDGRVLFVGGNEKDASSNKTTEIYDFQKNKFYKAGDLNEARTGHSAMLLKNGDVLVVGGDKYEKGKGPTSLRSAEIYKTKENKFVKISDLPQNMCCAEMIYLDEENVLLVENMFNMAVFNTTKLTFEKLNISIDEKNADAMEYRYHIIQLNQNYILFFPTYIDNDKHSTKLFLLNLSDFKMTKKELVLKHRSGFRIRNIDENKIVLFGGEFDYKTKSSEEFIKVINLTTGKTVSSSNFYQNRYYHNVIKLSDNNFLLLGGEDGMDYSLHNLNSTEIYVSNENRLIKFKKMLYKRSLPYFVKLNDGNYIIWGGCNAVGHSYPPEMLVVKNK